MSGACQPSSAELPIGNHNPVSSVGASPESWKSSSEMENENMSKVLHVNEQEFQAEVLNSEIPVVVDFYATWCPPCRALGPILDRLAAEFAGQIKFVKINSDEEQALASKYNVTGLPTLVFIANGNDVGQSAGLPNESALREHLNKWVSLRKAAAQ
jgi:thioredoxin 1